MNLELIISALSALLSGVNLYFILNVLYNHLRHIQSTLDQHIRDHATGEFK